MRAATVSRSTVQPFFIITRRGRFRAFLLPAALHGLGNRGRSYPALDLLGEFLRQVTLDLVALGFKGRHCRHKAPYSLCKGFIVGGDTVGTA